MHPLFELAVMLNQLFGITYFSDLSMLAHLVSISTGVSAKELLELPHAELRTILDKLNKLNNIFFTEKFNFLSFETVKNGTLSDFGLEEAMRILFAYLVGYERLVERFGANSNTLGPYNLIHGIVKSRFSPCIIMQIRFY